MEKLKAALQRHTLRSVALCSTEKDILAELRNWSEQDSQAVVASALKMSPQYLNDILKSRRELSARVIARMLDALQAQ